MVTRVLVPPPALLPGKANIVGTDSYIRLFDRIAGDEHFRRLITKNSEVGDLLVSSLGIGTSMGHETDEVDAEYRHSITRALDLGINIIDTSISYRSMRSEIAVGWALADAVGRGLIKREQVVVCTKGGYLTFECDRPAYNLNPTQWIEQTYFKRGIILSWADVVGDGHCITPTFLKDQVQKSRRNLGLETIDVYYIHNPEVQLLYVPRGEFYRRMLVAFKALEDCCNAGYITVYGVATWNGFRAPPEAIDHLSLEDLVNCARSAGGDGHHFRLLQLPFNLTMRDASDAETQCVAGESMSFLCAAKHLALQVVGSSSLSQGQLTGYQGEVIRNHSLPVQVQHCIADLGDEATDAQCALQFARTTPGILTALAGMRSVFHVEENAAVIKRLATYQYHPDLNIAPFSWRWGE